MLTSQEIKYSRASRRVHVSPGVSLFRRVDESNEETFYEENAYRELD
jgi:hypothetical protein